MTSQQSPGDYLRDKDRALADACAAAARAAAEGVEWLSQHREASLQRDTKQKQLRRQAVEARRLATAARRPMSVGVFGASQMGKSFLIGKLITPKDRPAHVLFGQGDDAVRQDFLSQVNPSGGDETTGLVTRFSLRPQETPPGHPVALRLLREVDIVKILVNTFIFDCKGQYRLRRADDEDAVEDRTPTPEALEALADSVGELCRSEPQSGMAVEDVYELSDYLSKSLPDHLMNKEEYEGFWQVMETMLPRLDGAGRVKLLEQLWAGLEEFSELYLQLKGALDTLGHPPRMFASLKALEDRSRGVLHVNTLRELDAEGAGQTLTVVSETGISAIFPTCVITALTAELCVTLETAPWPFFTHTDLLDFPGARSREDKPVHGFLRDPAQQAARANCFLRGKVAVLFDNYAADLDLNVMLLCAGPENQEVKTLPGLVREWISRTHGDSPQKRQGKASALFYCLTKCDTLFVQRVGAEAPVAARLGNNFGPYEWWMKEWQPGKPFDNTFLIRNPGIMDPGLFEYDGSPSETSEIPPEKAISAKFAEYLEPTFRPMFLSEPLVGKHVADPERKLAELLALNDGGTTYLAEALAPVCDPDLKFAQIAPRAEQAGEAVFQALSGFYETGDLEKRLAARLDRIRALIQKLRRKPGLIGPFIASFQVDETLMEAAYRHFRRNQAEAPVERDIFDDVFGDETGADGGKAEDGFGSVLVEWWAGHLEGKVAGSRWCEALEIDEGVLRGFVEELVVGAERRGLTRAIEGRIDGFTLNAMSLDAAARRVSIFTAFALNDEVNFPGGLAEPANEARFQPADVVAQPADILPEDPKLMDRMRLNYFKEWMEALEDMTRANASWGSGGRVDIAANARLGEILGLLGRSV